MYEICHTNKPAYCDISNENNFGFPNCPQTQKAYCVLMSDSETRKWCVPAAFQCLSYCNLCFKMSCGCLALSTKSLPVFFLFFLFLEHCLNRNALLLCLGVVHIRNEVKNGHSTSTFKSAPCIGLNTSYWELTEFSHWYYNNISLDNL